MIAPEDFEFIFVKPLPPKPRRGKQRLAQSTTSSPPRPNQNPAAMLWPENKDYSAESIVRKKCFEKWYPKTSQRATLAAQLKKVAPTGNKNKEEVQQDLENLKVAMQSLKLEPKKPVRPLPDNVERVHAGLFITHHGTGATLKNKKKPEAQKQPASSSECRPYIVSCRRHSF